MSQQSLLAKSRAVSRAGAARSGRCTNGRSRKLGGALLWVLIKGIILFRVLYFLQGFACQPHEPRSIREDSVTAEFEIGQTQNKELRRKEIPRRCIVGIGTAFGRGTIVRNGKAMAN